MAIQYRVVQGVMVYPKSGEPIKAGKLRFYLNKGFGLTSTHLISDAPRIVTTGEDGSFSIPLWCDETGLRPIDYIVNVPKESAGEPMTDAEHTGTFSLLPGDGTPIDLPVLLVASVPNPTPVDLLYQLIDARVATANAAAIDSTIVDGSVKSVSGNAVFDALGLKADLVAGKIPAGQLPSYVDDILEFPAAVNFPAIGETGKIYVVTAGADANKQYRWSGTVYVQFPTGTGGASTIAGVTGLTDALAGKIAKLTEFQSAVVTEVFVLPPNTNDLDLVVRYLQTLVNRLVPAAAPPSGLQIPFTPFVDLNPALLTTLLNGNDINSALDGSVNNRHAAAGVVKPTMQIINGVKTFRFGSGALFNLGDYSSLTEGEIFIVQKMDTDPSLNEGGGAAGGIWVLGTDDMSFVNYHDGAIYDHFGSTVRKTTGAAAAGRLANWFVYSAYSKANDWANFIDGVQRFQTVSNTVAFPTAAKFGGNGVNFFIRGNTARIIISPLKLTVPVRTQFINDIIAFYSALYV